MTALLTSAASTRYRRLGLAVLGLIIGLLAALPSGAAQAERRPAPPNSTAASTSVSTSPVAAVRQAIFEARHGGVLSASAQAQLASLAQDRAITAPCTYHAIYTKVCARGDVDAERSIVVIGDSHARMWIPAFDEIGKRYGFRTYYLVKSRCTASLVFPARVDNAAPFPGCVAFHNWVQQQVADLKPDLVVVSTSMVGQGVYVGDHRVTRTQRIELLYQRGLAELFRTLAPHADQTWLLQDVPMREGRFPGACLRNQGLALDDCFASARASRQALTDASVRAARWTNTPIVDPTKWVCWDGTCPAVIGDLLPYRDAQHLTAPFTRSLAEPLAKMLRVGQPGLGVQRLVSSGSSLSLLPLLG